MRLVLERCTIARGGWMTPNRWRGMRISQNLAGSARSLPASLHDRTRARILAPSYKRTAGMKFCVEIAHAAVGGIGVHPGKDVYRHTATVGYWLGEQFWGRGVMTEALTAVTDFCFDNFPLRRIFPEVFAKNPASARVLEKPHSSWKDV